MKKPTIITDALSIPLFEGGNHVTFPRPGRALAVVPSPTNTAQPDAAILADKVCDALGIERGRWLEMKERFDALVSALTTTARRADRNGKARR